VQTALHAAAARLGDFRRGAVQALRARPLPADGARPLPADGDGSAPQGGAEDDADRWEVEVIHQAQHGEETAYRVVVGGSRWAPSFLSCADGAPKAEVNYEALSFSRLP
jgi:hypothetical protein